MQGIRYKVLCCVMRCVLTLSICMYFTNTHAQRFPFHNLNVDDGLIQSQATCLAQDKTGNLWIGSLGGLSRYDGRNFTNYTVKNGMPANVVSAIAVDSTSNTLWISGTAGISQFDGHTFRHYNLPEGTSHLITGSQQINIVNDTVWWRAKGAVYFIVKGIVNTYPIPGSDAPVLSMLADNGNLWVAKDGLIYHHSGNKWDSVKFVLQADEHAPVINRLFRGRSGTLWVATTAGLYCVNAVSHQIDVYGSNIPGSFSLPAIISLTEDKSGAMWLGTASGVLKISGNSLQAFNKRNGLSDNRFFDMLTDAEGNVWMASDGQGLFRFSGSQFSGLDESMGLPSSQITAIAYNRWDSLYLATYDAGLYVFSGGKVTPLPFPETPTPVISCLLYTHGKLWIGTRGHGLWTYQRKIFRQYEAPDHFFPSNDISSLYADISGKIWVGFDNGIVVWDTDKFNPVAEKTSVVSFLPIGSDSVLIATAGGGLQLYTAGTLLPFTTGTLADSASINCFILQGENIWMGSSDNGVIRYNRNTRKILVINKLNGLRSDFIYNIIADNEHNIWVGTGYGIHKIKMNDRDVAQVTFYGKAQGITGMESNINAVVKQPDGSIWFGTTNGALHYQPHSSVVLAAPAEIVLQSVKISGENIIDHSYYDSTDSWYGIPYHLQLPYQKNNISFTYQAITLTGEQQLLYRYRMDGLETPWSDWSATNSVTYPALPPGKYIFRVQCQGSDGQNVPELNYEFEIVTPFQKTNYFRLAVLFTCILLGIFVQFIISNRKQRRLRLLDKLRSEEQSKIRIRTAEDFHDEVGNKLTRINVLTNVLKSKIAPTPDSTRILDQIQDNTSQLYSGTRDILWSLQPANDNLYEILYRIRDFGNELFQDTEVNFTFTGDDSKWQQYRLPMDMSRNLIMIFKEALNNALKYSGAKNISIEAKWKNKGILQIILKDDGRGFDMQTVNRGNGINNMQVRTGRLNGKLYIDSRKDKGTMLNLTFKIPQNRG